MTKARDMHKRGLISDKQLEKFEKRGGQRSGQDAPAAATGGAGARPKVKAGDTAAAGEDRAEPAAQLKGTVGKTPAKLGQNVTSQAKDKAEYGESGTESPAADNPAGKNRKRGSDQVDTKVKPGSAGWTT